nr:CAP-Gly domain-containing linker protein 1-like [Onthophagus taurus]XP_022919256.1 CAP-Gly domain-containing linker protein 1-like [Onthophagus taurus]
MEMEETTSPDAGKVDLATFELTQRKLVAELAMRKNQVEQLRQQEDIQNMKIHELQLKLDSATSRISDLEFELDIAKNTCASYNIQLKNVSTLQQKTLQDKLISENQLLKDLLQKSELEQRKLLRKMEDLTALNELQVSNKNDFLKQQSNCKEKIEELFNTFKNLEKESVKMKSIQDKLKDVKDHQHYIDVYKALAKNAIEKKDQIEDEYLMVKTKLDVLTDLLDKNPLPQPVSIINVEEYKQEIERLKQALEDERNLTIRQNARIIAEIAQNVTLCLKIDLLEKGGSKCMKDMCLQTEN